MRSLIFKNQKSRRGVVLIYFAMIFGVLLASIMMLLNTSVIIYQKIRLQMAVDLASYAGASVQASYLGNDASGEESIRALNQKILSRYGKLLNDLQFGSVVPWPMMIPVAAACTAACQAANVANGAHATKLYKDAVADIEELQNQIRFILEKLPEASRAAAEATLRANIPDLTIDQGGLSMTVTRDAEEVIRSQQVGFKGATSSKKNAVLSFSSSKGLYLTNAVGAVPHTFAYFGPVCFPQYNKDVPSNWTNWYCAVNGAGAPGGVEGHLAASIAFSQVYIPEASGNVGQIERISKPNANAIKLHYLQDPHKPDPFFIAGAEWYPENGSFVNLENSFGAKGSVFPEETRLVAMSAAEPFGANLATSRANIAFGTRLQSIRKVLLDPKMKPEVREDFGPLFKYMESLGPRDANGQTTESADDVIRRFLH